jgi:8-oxo-dGTP pyrophosphatase MutT (NUDIX family)
LQRELKEELGVEIDVGLILKLFFIFILNSPSFSWSIVAGSDVEAFVLWDARPSNGFIQGS